MGVAKKNSLLYSDITNSYTYIQGVLNSYLVKRCSKAHPPTLFEFTLVLKPMCCCKVSTQPPFTRSYHSSCIHHLYIQWSVVIFTDITSSYMYIIQGY